MHYSSFKEAMQIVHPWRLDAGAAGVPRLACICAPAASAPQHLSVCSPSRRSCWHVTEPSGL